MDARNDASNTQIFELNSSKNFPIDKLTRELDGKMYCEWHI